MPELPYSACSTSTFKCPTVELEGITTRRIRYHDTNPRTARSPGGGSQRSAARLEPGSRSRSCRLYLRHAGFKSLDQALSGFLAPGLHIIHANAGCGKSALCLQIAATCGAAALYVSAEMSALELFRRVIARTTSTFLGRLKTGEYPPDQALRLAQRAAREVPWLFFADASAGAVAPPDWIEAALVQFHRSYCGMGSSSSHA